LRSHAFVNFHEAIAAILDFRVRYAACFAAGVVGGFAGDVVVVFRAEDVGADGGSGGGFNVGDDGGFSGVGLAGAGVREGVRGGGGFVVEV
jgi:hypothetical protein